MFAKRPDMPEAAPRSPESIVVDGDRVLVYPATRKGLRNVNKRALFIRLPYAILVFVSCGFELAQLCGQRASLLRQSASAFAGGPAPGLIHSLDAEIACYAVCPWVIALLFVVTHVAMVRYLRKQADPIITLTPEGIVINSQMTKIGLLLWDELADIRTYNLIHRFLGIIPRDITNLCSRMGSKRGALLRANAFVIPVFRFFGIFAAPINIAQEYLPVTADEMLDRINRYVAALPRNVPEGVWPPPTGRQFR
ncbi:MAG: hypothetical protein ACLQVD_05970 [Capsulimonadaceae bacterium]